MTDHSILIVDDELLIRDLLYDFFMEQGWQTSVADNGEKALNILESKKIDLVLTDLRIPDMDGLELTSEVRKTHPEIPVVVMTAYPSVDSVIAALREKVADFVTKPFNINQLYKLVTAHIKDADMNRDKKSNQDNKTKSGDMTE